MGAHSKFEDLKKIEPEYLANLLARSNLSSKDREIAVNILRWDMTYVDAGEALGMNDETQRCDRTTVSWRMKNKIAPRLRELVALDNQRIEQAGA